MNTVINMIKPALIYRLKKYVDPVFVTSYAAALLMCYSQNICDTVRPLMERIKDDEIIKRVEAAYKYMDEDLAKQLFAWWLRCTRRRRVKLLQRMDTQEVFAYDYTEEYLKYDPQWEC